MAMTFDVMLIETPNKFVITSCHKEQVARIDFSNSECSYEALGKNVNIFQTVNAFQLFP